jgi:hypothetical protein
MTVDNQWVVPYNPYLSKKYNAHINVEICTSVSAVKYLYKYIYKGPDRIMFSVGGHHDSNIINEEKKVEVVDEVQEYIDARYLGASEACWRIFGKRLHERFPPVDRLPFHVENQQRILFDPTDPGAAIERAAETNFLQFMATCAKERVIPLPEALLRGHPGASELTYPKFVQYYHWKKNSRIWVRRTIPPKTSTVGRMFMAGPRQGERFYLRMLLHIVKGPISYEYIRTHDGYECSTFKESCFLRGLLEDGREWFQTLREAAQIQGGAQLRKLFVVILRECNPQSPTELWWQFKESLSDDFRWRRVHCEVNREVPFMEEDFQNSLRSLEQTMTRMNDTLVNYGLEVPLPTSEDESDVGTQQQRLHRIIVAELDYDTSKQAEDASTAVSMMNCGQQDAYNAVQRSLSLCPSEGALFFIDAPGGTGKTFLAKALLASVRAQGNIGLAMASSGIAATLLPGGRTVHSRCKVPLKIHDNALCAVSFRSHTAQLFRRTKLFLWDEAPMAHRYILEAINRTLQDIMENDDIFGGKVFVCMGDFRQVLPIIRRGSKSRIIGASLKTSKLWKHAVILNLTQNERVRRLGIGSEFPEWLLSLGSGTLPSLPNRFGEPLIEVPQNMLLLNDEGAGNQDINKLIEWTFPQLKTNYKDHEWMQGRGILTPKNIDVDRSQFDTIKL